MFVAAFLDTGVVFGYCVPFDEHHVRCDDYIEDQGGKLFICPEVNTEYKQMKESRIQELSTDVLGHVQSLSNADLDVSLGPMDIDHIKKKILNRNNGAYQFLYWYYDEEVGSFIQREELINNLRQLARDIETVAIQRKQDLDSKLEIWKQQDTHSSVRSSLSMIHQQDLDICVIAHDLADHIDDETEFVTTNPQDFIDKGREETILETTEIDSIQTLAIR